MADIDLRSLSQDDVVIHFGGRPNEVDASTFSTALVAISEAVVELNRQVNPSSSVEIIVEGIGPGSFRIGIQEEGVRVIENKVKVTVLEVIFERSSRKWRFVWNGIRISASIKDDDFFNKLESGEYVFSQGVILEVTLKIYQIKDKMSRAFMNDRYEIIKVHGLENDDTEAA